MSTTLPEGVNPGDSVLVEWEADKDAVMITVSLSDATIMCESRSDLGGEQLTLMVGALQSILVKAFDAIEIELDEEEDRG